MRTNQEDVAIFHSGEQGKLDDIIEHIKSEFSWVIEKWPMDVVELKTPRKLIWDPTKNPTFWYRETIALSFHTNEDEIAQFEILLEKFRWFQW